MDEKTNEEHQSINNNLSNLTSIELLRFSSSHTMLMLMLSIIDKHKDE
jgi:hypothetical protein